MICSKLGLLNRWRSVLIDVDDVSAPMHGLRAVLPGRP